jgi:metallophosphoesterase superfamily enzyme
VAHDADVRAIDRFYFLGIMLRGREGCGIGSSGAGTSSVTRTFENIFRREGVKSAVIEGDSFHRYDR